MTFFLLLLTFPTLLLGSNFYLQSVNRRLGVSFVDCGEAGDACAGVDGNPFPTVLAHAHVPKCSGTFTRQALADHNHVPLCTLHNCCLPLDGFVDLECVNKHPNELRLFSYETNVTVLSREIHKSEDAGANVLYLLVVRDPVEWLYSAFYQLCLRNPQDLTEFCGSSTDMTDRVRERGPQYFSMQPFQFTYFEGVQDLSSGDSVLVCKTDFLDDCFTVLGRLLGREVAMPPDGAIQDDNRGSYDRSTVNFDYSLYLSRFSLDFALFEAFQKTMYYRKP